MEWKCNHRIVKSLDDRIYGEMMFVVVSVKTMEYSGQHLCLVCSSPSKTMEYMGTICVLFALPLSFMCDTSGTNTGPTFELFPV